MGESTGLSPRRGKAVYTVFRHFRKQSGFQKIFVFDNPLSIVLTPAFAPMELLPLAPKYRVMCAFWHFFRVNTA